MTLSLTLPQERQEQRREILQILSRGLWLENGKSSHEGDRPSTGDRTSSGESKLDVLLGELDSIQIISHTEWYAHTPHHELVMLRQTECQRLTNSMQGLMCGASPALRSCTDDDRALQRLNEGCGPIAEDQWNADWRYSEPLQRLIGAGPLPQCYDSLGCYAETEGRQGQVWCPRDLRRGWRVSRENSYVRAARTE